MNDEIRTKIMETALQLYKKGHKQDQIIKAMAKLYPTTNSINCEHVIKSSLGMLRSFDRAISAAGGSSWPINKLLKMTFMDLISNFATNHIRFIFIEPEKK